MLRQGFGRAAGPHRTRCKPAQRLDPIIHHNHACHTDIDAKLCRDFDCEVAPLNRLGRQRSPFGTQQIGRLGGMAEAWQLNRILGQLNADQCAAFRQDQLVNGRDRVIGDLAGRRRCVRECIIIGHMRVHGEHKACVKCVCRAHQGAQISRFRQAFRANGKIAAHADPHSLIRFKRP